MSYSLRSNTYVACWDLANFAVTLQAHPCSSGKNETTIVVAYNSGMGSGDRKLQDSWSADVAFLLDQDVLCLFTCANDYMDVPGEREVMNKHDARFLLEPCTCPFAAMTVLVPEGPHSHCTTQANSFVYAVKGRLHKQPGHEGKTTKASNGAGVHMQEVPCSAASATTAQSHMSIPSPPGEVTKLTASEDSARKADGHDPRIEGAMRGTPSTSASDIISPTAAPDSKMTSPPSLGSVAASCSNTPHTATTTVESAPACCEAGALGKGIDCGMSNGGALPQPLTTDDRSARSSFFDVRGLDISSHDAKQLQARLHLWCDVHAPQIHASLFAAFHVLNACR